jgi:hypothetical protein
VSQTLTRATPADLRPASRWIAALLLPIGPVAIAVLRLIMPYDTNDDPATITGKIIGELDQASLMLWLALIGTLTLVRPCTSSAG